MKMAGSASPCGGLISSRSPVFPCAQVYSPSQTPTSPLKTSEVDGLPVVDGLVGVVGFLDDVVVVFDVVRTRPSAARGSPATGLPHPAASTSSSTTRHTPRCFTADIVPGAHA